MATADFFMPSQAEAALAMAILKAKPANISARDYVLQLRCQVKTGPILLNELEQGHHLDLVAYWQEQYRRVQNECDALRTENIKLERSNHLLSSRNGQIPHEYSSNVTQTPKRKAPATVAARTSKRTKASQQKTPEQLVGETQEAIEDDFVFLDGLGEDGANLTEALFTTHKLCRSIRSDAQSLCSSLVHTSQALGKVVRFVALKHERFSLQSQRAPGPASLDQDKSKFALAMTVCARAFMSVLVGIHKMVEASHDERLPHVVISELATSFKTALNAIESVAHQTAQSVRQSQQLLSKKDKSRKPPMRESVPARAIAHLLIAFLGFLDKEDRIHQQLFDSFVYLLLERVGRRLFYCTFGRHRDSDIEKGLGPLIQSDDQAEASKQETQALGIRFEVKALVLVLERAMGLAPGHMNPQNSKLTRTTTRPCRTLSLRNLPLPSKARLSTSAKDRLQRTLVTCMFGDKVNDEFLDVLTKPVPGARLSSLQNVAKIEEKDVDEWYRKEVWRLVGWDILARESGW